MFKRLFTTLLMIIFVDRRVRKKLYMAQKYQSNPNKVRIKASHSKKIELLHPPPRPFYTQSNSIDHTNTNTITSNIGRLDRENMIFNHGQQNIEVSNEQSIFPQKNTLACERESLIRSAMQIYEQKQDIFNDLDDTQREKLHNLAMTFFGLKIQNKNNAPNRKTRPNKHTYNNKDPD